MMVIICGSDFSIIFNFEITVISDMHQACCICALIAVSACRPNVINIIGCKVEDGTAVF
jgi:hypothetical protein